MWHSVKEDQVSRLKCLCLLSVSLTFSFSDNLCGLLFLILSLHQINNIIIIQTTIIVTERQRRQKKKKWWTWWNCRNSCRGGSSRLGTTTMSMSTPTENSCMSKSWPMNSWKLWGNKLLSMPPFVTNSSRCTEHSQLSRILQVPLLSFTLSHCYVLSFCNNYELYQVFF